MLYIVGSYTTYVWVIIIGNVGSTTCLPRSRRTNRFYKIAWKSLTDTPWFAKLCTSAVSQGHARIVLVRAPGPGEEYHGVSKSASQPA
eukprot:243223-Alexandrium_andersonii.AAC.1